MINEALNDQFIFPGNRYQHSAARTWRRSLRKRRANSDSELPLPLVDYGCHGIADDSVIDFLTDSSMERTDLLMARSATMDPSQMFIGSSNPTHNFASSSSNVGMHLSDESHMGTLVDGLDNNLAGSLFSTQFFYVDGLASSSSTDSAHHHHQQQQQNQHHHQNQLIGESLTDGSVYTDTATNTTTTMHAVDATETIPRHIPAKYRKNMVSVEFLNNPLVPLVKSDVADDYTINKQWVSTQTDKQELKKKGIEWKNGLWSTAEEEILRTNIDAYCEKNNIVDPTLMIFSEFKDNRKQFYRSISKGLNRTLFAVYRKVTRMYDDKNYQGRYSEEEEARLIELCEETNCNWALIGDALGRSATSVKDKARMLKNRKKKGKWDDSELERLSKAVHALTNTKYGESVTNGINWAKIAETVNTRSEKQCFNKWLNQLNWKEAGGKKWIKTDEIELINRISNSNVKEETDLNWTKLSNNWPCVRSPQWLRNKWWKIKTNVPKYKITSFPDILSYLKTTYVASIWDKCKHSVESSSTGESVKQSEEDKGVVGDPEIPPTTISNISFEPVAADNFSSPVPEKTRYKKIAPKTTTTCDSFVPSNVHTLSLNAPLSSDTLPTRTYTPYADLNYEPLQMDLVLVTSNGQSTSTTVTSVSDSTRDDEKSEATSTVDQSAAMWQAWV